MADKRELIQKRAIKIIYGQCINYEESVNDGTIETLESRRTKKSLNFALRNTSSVRFGHKWFPANMVERDARRTTRDKFQEKRCRTERERNNPLNFMIRQLNEHFRNEEV